jgi:transcription initiation factor TFIIIB Brf1 subunit/transcription initiation factor TFIIB
LFLNKGLYELALICLYAACQIHRISKSAKLFSSIGDVEEEEILRDYELLVGKLNL